MTRQHPKAQPLGLAKEYERMSRFRERAILRGTAPEFAHGDYVRGERHHEAKLSADTVTSARIAWREAEPKNWKLICRLAKARGVQSVTLKAALAGNTWAHVPFPPGYSYDPPRLQRRRGEAVWKAVLREKDIPIIVEKYLAGVSGDALAKQYGMSKYAIWSVLSGRSWKHVPRPKVELRRGGGQYGPKFTAADDEKVFRLRWGARGVPVVAACLEKLGPHKIGAIGCHCPRSKPLLSLTQIFKKTGMSPGISSLILRGLRAHSGAPPPRRLRLEEKTL